MNRTLSFVTCASAATVLSQRLLASPCLADGRWPLAIYSGTSSAATAFNSEMARCPQSEWLVWLHQDVFLPAGWDECFTAAVEDAERLFGRLAVVGIYGISGAGTGAIRAGHMVDRGRLLEEPAALPCLVDSLDEFLFAVRTDSCLLLDPALGFDFYATDVVQSARERGLNAAVVDACCEHWSGTPRSMIPAALADRVSASGAVFERKWAHRLPLDTPCFSIGKTGDVSAQCDALCGPGAA